MGSLQLFYSNTPETGIIKIVLFEHTIKWDLYHCTIQIHQKIEPETIYTKQKSKASEYVTRRATYKDLDILTNITSNHLHFYCAISFLTE